MKNKMLYLAKLNIRSEAVGGGELPSDEMQYDFVISNSEVDGHGSIMTESTLRNYAEEKEKKWNCLKSLFSLYLRKNELGVQYFYDASCT